MRNTQFNTRFLLVLTAAFALAITAIQFGARRFPGLWIFAMFASFVFAVYGVVLVALAGALAISILTSGIDERRGENLRRCVGLAGAASIAFTPVILWFIVLAFISK